MNIYYDDCGYCYCNPHASWTSNNTFYSITVKNNGLYDARFTVSYFFQGRRTIIYSRTIKPSHQDSIVIPKGSTSVETKITNTSVRPFKVFCEKFLPFAITEVIPIYGTKVNPYCDTNFNNNFC